LSNLSGLGKEAKNFMMNPFSISSISMLIFIRATFLLQASNGVCTGKLVYLLFVVQ
jgi:hypothetical protein